MLVGMRARLEQSIDVEQTGQRVIDLFERPGARLRGHPPGEEFLMVRERGFESALSLLARDPQTQEMRRQTEGTGVDVIRQGDDLLLRMPSGITFAFDSYEVQPQFQSTLNEIASTLNAYESTYVDVMGHTDSTGSDSYNLTLSQRRAQGCTNGRNAGAVAVYLRVPARTGAGQTPRQRSACHR